MEAGKTNVEQLVESIVEELEQRDCVRSEFEDKEGQKRSLTLKLTPLTHDLLEKVAAAAESTKSGLATALIDKAVMDLYVALRAAGRVDQEVTA